MNQGLLFRVRLHDGRYHGQPEWPPAPARLFQALICAGADHSQIKNEQESALRWLEGLERPPIISAPHAALARAYDNYVPNNDLDSVGNDPRRIGEIRVKKTIRPRLFNSDVSFIYLWSFVASSESLDHAARLCQLAERLYQFGCGIDMAWATGEVLELSLAESLLTSTQVIVYRPGGAGGLSIACPEPGSFDSVLRRYASMRTRFRTPVTKKSTTRREPTEYVQPPKPSFRTMSYYSPGISILYELRTIEGGYYAVPQTRVVELTESIRDAAAAMLGQSVETERFIVGRGASATDQALRVRIVPLPSIGSDYADGSIRRVLVEIPDECPISVQSLQAAFSGLQSFDPQTGQVTAGWTLVQTDDTSMLRHFGCTDNFSATCWRTVTPVCIPSNHPRVKKIRGDDTASQKTGSQRVSKERKDVFGLVNSIRHAGIAAKVLSARIQHEPFDRYGNSSKKFVTDRHLDRFSYENLRHIEVLFDRPVQGPLIIGNGRYLGLGLMRPVTHSASHDDGVLSFKIVGGLSSSATTVDVSRALRRATIARLSTMLGVQGQKKLDTYFCGHDADGSAASDKRHQHLAFWSDLSATTLYIVAPHYVQGRQPDLTERVHLQTLACAMKDFEVLKAGRAGVLSVSPAQTGQSWPWEKPAREWVSLGSYSVERHVKADSASRALEVDCARALRKSGHSKANITVRKIDPSTPGSPLSGEISLSFERAQTGPIAIGRNWHFGGGVFVPASNG